MEILTNHQPSDNKALDAEPPIASFLKSMLLGGGPVNAAVICMEFTPLESAVLTWIADHADEPAVAKQLAVARPIKREFTGVGSFTALEVPADFPRVHVRPAEPVIESPQLGEGGGSVLLFVDGLAQTLELYSHGESFPEQIQSWRLS